MNILLVNHGQAASYRGGDDVQIQEKKKRLQLRGHSVTSVNSDNPETNGFDLVHIFNYRTIDSLEKQIKCCKQGGIRVVKSPIWISINQALWGSRGSHAILEKGIKEGDKIFWATRRTSPTQTRRQHERLHS